MHNEQVRRLRLARDAATAALKAQIAKADWLDMSRGNSRYGGLYAECALQEIFPLRAKVREAEAALQAATTGKPFLARICAMYSEAEMRAAGWKYDEALEAALYGG